MIPQDQFRDFGQARRWICLCAVALWAACLAIIQAADTNSPASWPTPEERFATAKAAVDSAPTNAAAAVGFVQACFDVAWSSTNSATKARFAEDGIQFGKQALLRHPKEAGLEYYVALNLGQLASTRGLSALKLVREMESRLHVTRRLDPNYSDAGADRSLGYLYLQAPGWPVSIGSNDKARTHFESAIKLAPLYPEHYLALAEACLGWKRKDEARKLVTQAEELWPKAKEHFTGPRWQADWLDWEKRLQALKEKLKAR